MSDKMREALLRLDAMWTTEFPGGPDTRFIGGVAFDAETIEVWRSVREALAQPEQRDAGLQRAWAVAAAVAKPLLDFYAQNTAPPAPGVQDDVAKDAARYRWLRDESGPSHELFLATRSDCAGTLRTSNGIADTIDAAMLDGPTVAAKGAKSGGAHRF